MRTRPVAPVLCGVLVTVLVGVMATAMLSRRAARSNSCRPVGNPISSVICRTLAALSATSPARR